jgi:hypothetical protein
MSVNSTEYSDKQITRKMNNVHCMRASYNLNRESQKCECLKFFVQKILHVLKFVRLRIRCDCVQNFPSVMGTPLVLAMFEFWSYFNCTP